MADGGNRVDGRSERRAKVLPFLSKVERQRKDNLEKLKVLASAIIEQLTSSEWKSETWSITATNLLRRAGRNRKSATLTFRAQERAGGALLRDEFNLVAKALVVLRYHRHAQAIENQRSFVTAITYIASAVGGSGLFRLTEAHLNAACEAIAHDYEEGAAYNLHKAVGEFAAHVDANGLSRIPLNFKYARMARPENAGGLEIQRLDDPAALVTESAKMASAGVYRLLGRLYQVVPADHRFRLHILVLAILASAGRRFAEVATLPLKCLKPGPNGEIALLYFPKKYSKGQAFTPCREAWLATEMATIIVSAVDELTSLCAAPREIAMRVRQASGPALDFLKDEREDSLYGPHELEALGLPGGLLQINGWLRLKGFARTDDRRRLTTNGQKPWVTTLEGIRRYCERDFHPGLVSPIHIDEFGNSLYLDDMLICQFLYLGGTGGDLRAFWLANSYSHVMLHKFIERQLPKLAKEFAPELESDIDFTSHAFRHTINTLLDEGGMPELLQTNWFGRKHAQDTKAYQHTSRAKRLLEVRQALRDGKADGLIQEKIKKIPIELKDAYLEARVRAVHDIGPGVCIHDFSQIPCERHLQCSAECDDMVWAKSDPGRIEEVKRQWAMAVVALETAEARAKGDRPRRSGNWISHAKKKIKTLQKQLDDNGIAPFDPHNYLSSCSDEG